MNLVWLRNDLRTADNSALYAATSGGQAAIAVYVWSSGQHQLHDTAPVRLNLIRAHLRDLSHSLAKHGIALHVIEQSSFWQIPQTLMHFAQEHGVSSLFFNDEYGDHEKQRDEKTQQLFRQDGRSVFRFCDRVLLTPGAVLNQDGQPYKVFTSFARRAQMMLERTPPVLSAPLTQNNPVDAPALPWTKEAERLPSQWWIGEKETLRRFQQFVQDKVRDYAEWRDFPAKQGTSSMSPYLAIGAISPRQVMVALNQIKRSADREGGESYKNEILWREFYNHLLALMPRLSQHKPFITDTDLLPWSHDEKRFAAWCEARTGVPIVDAAMRQLLQTGWMHNRCRMIVASYLTKNLFIDWRWGERFFMQHLIDGDLAANNGGWQWSASVGTDAAPYFRVFNPVTQGQRFDPSGEYIKQFLPELANEPSVRIHETGHRLNYPGPLVELTSSRAQAITHFQQLQQLRKQRGEKQ